MKSTTSPIGHRIKELITRLGLNQTSFAESVGVSQNAIFKTVSGQTTPRYSLMEAILKAYPNVNREWLFEEKGEMLNVTGNLPQNMGTYLQEHLLRLEEGFQKLNQQIEVKDRQIEAKDRQIEMLISQLGKPKDVIEETQIVPLWREVAKADKAYA